MKAAANHPTLLLLAANSLSPQKPPSVHRPAKQSPLQGWRTQHEQASELKQRHGGVAFCDS
eukprot:2672624-Alexandrium_andersonii.AAC.1